MGTAADGVAPRPERAAALLGRSVVALVVLYVVLDIVVGLLPPHYSLIHNAESDYGVGPYAFLMDINFILRGVAAILLVAALVRTRRALAHGVGAVCFVLWGVASAVLAFFPTNLEGMPLTTSGQVHLVAAGIAFLAVASGISLLGAEILKAEGRVFARPILTGLSVAVWLFFLLDLLAFGGLAHPNFWGRHAGLIERLFLLAVLAWTAYVATKIARHPQAGAPDVTAVGT